MVLRLGLLTSMNLMNFPGTNGSALLSTVSTTGPGVTSCPFAALRPGLNVMSCHSRRSFIVTSVPKVVRNTDRNGKLKLHFLHRVRHGSLLLFVVPTSDSSVHGSCRILLGRLGAFGPRVLSGRQMLTVAGDSVLSRRLVSRVRPALPRKVPRMFVSSMSNLNVSILGSVL